MTEMLTPKIEQRLRALIVEMVAGKRPGATIGPADVARRYDDEGWRRWMDSVKEVARRLAAAGVIEVTRHGKPVEGWPWRGVIRFRARVAPAERASAANVSAARDATAAATNATAASDAAARDVTADDSDLPES